MSYRWRRARTVEDCGAEFGCRIQVGEPLREQWIRCNPDTPGQRPLLRCARHAGEPAPDLPPLEEHRTVAEVQELAARDDAEAPLLRPRPMTRLRHAAPSALPFDGRMAAAGRDD